MSTTSGTFEQNSGLSENELDALFESAQNKKLAELGIEPVLKPAEPVIPDKVEAKEEAPATESVGEETPATDTASAEKESPNSKDSPPTQEQGKTATPSEPAPEKTVEQLKQELADLQHKWNSQVGRISAYQRQINDLKSQLAAFHAAQPRKPEKAAAGKNEEPSFINSPSYQKLKSADPELAEVIKDLMATQESRLKDSYEAVRVEDKSVEAEQRHQAYVLEQGAKLREWVPNLDTEVLPSQEFQYFLNTVAPPGVRQLLNSPHAEDVYEGLQSYARWIEQAAPAPAKQQPATEVPASKPKSEVDVTKLDANRSRRLAAADVTSNQSVSLTQQGAELDEDALFKQAFNSTMNRIRPQPVTRR